MSSLFESEALSPTIEAPERRNSARSPLYMMVRPRGLDDPWWAWDIGPGGMLCRTSRPTFPGTYLDLKFSLPHTEGYLSVGGQVVALNQIEGELNLGVRFCMPSVKVQRSIVRFLDRRRELWNPTPLELTDAPLVLPPEPEPKPAPSRPFEALLLEANAALQAKEMRHLAFVRTLQMRNSPGLKPVMMRNSPNHLPRLSSLVRAL